MTPAADVPAAEVRKKERAPEIPSIEDLKALIIESGSNNNKKSSGTIPVTASPGEAGKDDIDKMLESALSGIGLGMEKKKAVTPPPAAPPAAVKPKPEAVEPPPQRPSPPPTPPFMAGEIKAEPIAPRPAAEETKPAPSPAVKESKPAPTPNHPQTRKAGWDKRLVFGPPPMSPPPPAAEPQKARPVPPPAQTQAAKPKSEPAPPAPARPDSPRKLEVTAKDAAPAPKPAESPMRPSQTERGFRSAPKLFEDLHEPKKRSPVPKLAAAGAAAVCTAIALFVLFRPKETAAPIQAAVNTPSNPSISELLSQVPAEPDLNKEQPAKPPAEKTQPAPANAAASEPALPPVSAAPLKAEPSRMQIKLPAEKPGTAQAGGSGTPAEKPQPPPAKTEEAVTPPNGEPARESVEEPPAPVRKAMLGELVSLEKVDIPPKPLKQVDPVYPTRAQMFGVEGSITVNALISEEGTVIDTGILKGMKDDLGLEKAAEAAVRKWKFEPAQKDGVNVRVWRPIVIVFKVK